MSDHATNPDLKGWISVDEVPDIKSLQDELRRLRDENHELRGKVGNAEAQVSKADRSTSTQELIDILSSIKLKIPGKLAGGKEVDSDLFSIAYGNRDTLITGVTNSMGSSAAEQFYFFNIIPKLQAHGLADCKQDTGVKYRRGFLNKKGQEFVAEVERTILLGKVKASDMSSTGKVASKETETTEKTQPKSGGRTKVHNKRAK